jgi:hypothetical protein
MPRGRKKAIIENVDEKIEQVSAEIEELKEQLKEKKAELKSLAKAKNCSG